MVAAVRSRRSGATAVVLLALALAGWLAVIERYGDMPAQPGTMGLGALAFVGAWTLMMAAMMLPAVTPVASLYAGSLVSAGRGARTVRTAALVAGYLLVWSAAGVAAYLAALAAGRLASDHPDLAVWVGAGVLATAGVYQLTATKHRCLSHCRAPFALLFRMAGGPGPLRDLRAGVWHGGYCLGCCFALMASLIALGAMSVGWMLLLTAVIVSERSWRHGPWVTRAAAVGLLGLAVFVPWHPGLVPGLHGSPAPMGM